jgi:hypothetical protein
MDELCALTLFILFFYVMAKTPDWTINKAFLMTLAVFVFYTVYSLWIGSNTPRGIINDLAIQIKPYLGFFCVYQLKPVFDEKQKKLLKEISLFFWILFLLPLGILSLVSMDVLFIVMEHPVYYGIAVVIVALCYLYCSEFTKRNKMIFLVLLVIGLFCSRSKFYGFYALAIFMVLFFSNIKQFKLNFRNILIILCMLAVIIVVAWQKISLYFFQVLTNEVDEDLIARFVLYRNAPDILRDYFPFGSGFASYATFSSGLYYSDIYIKYGIEYVWGLSKSYHGFISDTYYPSLAQFGVAGIALYLLFWGYIVRKTYVFYLKSRDTKSLIIILMIVGFLAIEGTTGSTFIAQGGFFVMMMMGLILSGMSQEQQIEKK